MNKRNNQFLYEGNGEAWSKIHILAVIPGAYELSEIAELMKKKLIVTLL